MARIVNEAAHAQRRNAILDAAERAVATKGYEQMAIADLLGELKISSGAFYHYFDSKPTLLMAMVDRISRQVEQLVLPIVEDQQLDAFGKLQLFFDTLDRWKLAHRDLVLGYMRVWYADDNAIVRHKLYVNRAKRLAPLLEKIIQQGIEEGVFTNPYPDQAARIMLSLLEDIAYAATDILLAEEHTLEDVALLERILAACTDALERLLGVETGALQHRWREELKPWLNVRTHTQA